MAAKPTAESHPCACSTFDAIVREITDEDDNMVDVETTDTGCTATTRREFAPGHDAKLKGFLIRWEAAGYDIRELTDGIAITRSAVDHAANFGFAVQVARGVRLAVEKAEARAAKADAKHAAKAAKTGQAPVEDVTPVVAELPIEDEAQAEAPLKMRAKVGRWEYDGELHGTVFVYTTKTGEVKSTNQFAVVI